MQIWGIRIATNNSDEDGGRNLNALWRAYAAYCALFPLTISLSLLSIIIVIAMAYHSLPSSSSSSSSSSPVSTLPVTPIRAMTPHYHFKGFHVSPSQHWPNLPKDLSICCPSSFWIVWRIPTLVRMHSTAHLYSGPAMETLFRGKQNTHIYSLFFLKEFVSLLFLFTHIIFMYFHKSSKPWHASDRLCGTTLLPHDGFSQNTIYIQMSNFVFNFIRIQMSCMVNTHQCCLVL